MNCSGFRLKLQSLIEERASLAAAEDDLREHLANCGDSKCRDAWYELCLLDQAIGDWLAGIPDLEFRERVAGELQALFTEARSEPAVSPIAGRPVRGVHRVASSRARRQVPSRWIVVTLALFVLVWLIAIVMTPMSREDALSGPGTVAERESNPKSDAPPAAPNGPFGPRQQQLAEAELSSTYLSYAEDATHFLTDTVALTLAGDEDIEDPTAAAAWIYRVQDRVGPWGEQFDAALDRFLGTLPDSES